MDEVIQMEEHWVEASVFLLKYFWRVLQWERAIKSETVSSEDYRLAAINLLYCLYEWQVFSVDFIHFP
jgi:hypothetical protein